MALTPPPSTLTSRVNISSDHHHPSSPSLHFLLPPPGSLSSPPSSFSLHLSALNRSMICFETLKVLSRSKCFAKSPTTAEDFVGDYDSLNVSGDEDDDGSSGGDGGREDAKKIDSSSSSSTVSSLSDSTSLGIREPVYEVLWILLFIWSLHVYNSHRYGFFFEFEQRLFLVRLRMVMCKRTYSKKNIEIHRYM